MTNNVEWQSWWDDQSGRTTKLLYDDQTDWHPIYILKKGDIKIIVPGLSKQTNGLEDQTHWSDLEDSNAKYHSNMSRSLQRVKNKMEIS